MSLFKRAGRPCAGTGRSALTLALVHRIALALVAMTCALFLPAIASAATVGTSTVGSSIDSNTPGRSQDYRFTANGSGPVDRLSVYLDGSSTANTVELGLYSGTSTSATSRRARCVITRPQPNAWNRCSVPAYSVVSGSTYWLPILHPAGGTGMIKYRNRTGTGNASYPSSSASLASLPATWTNGSNWGGQTASVYADKAQANLQASAKFTVNPTSPGADQSATFTAQGGGDAPLAYKWTDPDDKQVYGTGSTLAFTFHSLGTHHMQLDVTDANGDTATVTHPFEVVAGGPPPPPVDTDGDGVPDSADVCPGTPAGTTVDATGCPVTRPADTTAPTTTITSSPPDGTSTSGSLSFAGADNVGVDHFDCRMSGAAYASCVNPKTYTGLAVGTHTVDVVAVDAAGNVDASPATSTWTTSAPQGGNNCMPAPTTCGYPDVSTTGVPAGVTLTKVSGSVTLSTPGQVYENKELTGDITVTAPNVTIRNVRLINTSPYYPVSVKNQGSWETSNANLVLDHVDLNMGGVLNLNGGIAFNGYTLRHVFMHNGSDCVAMGENVTIEDSMCVVGPDTNNDGKPDNSSFCNGPEHFDGFQTDGGGNILVRHNTIRNPCSQTSAIMLSDDLGGLHDVTIDNNLLAGGGWTLYCTIGDGHGSTNQSVTNNRFAKLYYANGGYWGPTATCEHAQVYTGTVWDDTGLSLGGDHG